MGVMDKNDCITQGAAAVGLSVEAYGELLLNGWRLVRSLNEPDMWIRDGHLVGARPTGVITYIAEEVFIDDFRATESNL